MDVLTFANAWMSSAIRVEPRKHSGTETARTEVHSNRLTPLSHVIFIWETPAGPFNEPMANSASASLGNWHSASPSLYKICGPVVARP